VNYQTLEVKEKIRKIAFTKFMHWVVDNIQIRNSKELQDPYKIKQVISQFKEEAKDEYYGTQNEEEW